MIEKNRISKKEYKEIIDEILLCQKALEKRFDVYISNTITRLIEARIKLALSTVDNQPLPLPSMVVTKKSASP